MVSIKTVFLLMFSVEYVASLSYQSCRQQVISTKTSLRKIQNDISYLERRLEGGNPCEEGWVLYKDHCYYFSKHVENWYNAEMYCRNKESFLVNVENEAENSWILSHSQDATFYAYWLGLTDMQEGKWIWTVDFKPITYAKWEPTQKEPNGGVIENCGHFIGYSGFWNDKPCTDSLKFICKKTIASGFLIFSYSMLEQTNG